MRARASLLTVLGLLAVTLPLAPLARAEHAGASAEHARRGESLAVAHAGQARQEEGLADLAIVGVTLFDGVSATPRTDVTVLVAGGRIVEVGESRRVRVPDTSRVIDGAGRFLMPGLWDAHAHLSYWGDDALPRLVSMGVTGIREMGGDPEELGAWKRQVETGERTGPRFVWCGPFLEGPEGGDEYRLTVRTPAEARSAARALLERGVDFLKIQPRIAPELVEVLVEEARAHGRTVVGHLPDGVSLERGVGLGLRSIEHMSPYAGLDEAELARMARLFREHGTWMSPALYSVEAALVARGEDPRDDPGFLQARRAIRVFHEAGVGILVGSNFAYRDWPQQPGTSLHEEMRALVDAGMPPADVLRAATSGIAGFLGVDDRIGIVREGMDADLVMLAANPLEDIRNTRRIDAVVLRGRLLDRPALEELGSR